MCGLLYVASFTERVFKAQLGCKVKEAPSSYD
jgi:hypothetical protein